MYGFEFVFWSVVLVGLSIVPAKAGGGGGGKGGGGLRDLLAAGILAKVLGEKGHGHHGGHSSVYPIPIPMHHGGHEKIIPIPIHHHSTKVIHVGHDHHHGGGHHHYGYGHHHHHHRLGHHGGVMVVGGHHGGHGW